MAEQPGWEVGGEAVWSGGPGGGGEGQEGSHGGKDRERQVTSDRSCLNILRHQPSTSLHT